MQTSPHSTPSRGTPSRRGKSPKITTTPAIPGPNFAPVDQLDKHPSTFYSCLRIPVQGAVPIEPEGSAKPSTTVSDVTDQPARTARQSKTDALTALNTQERSSSEDPDDSEAKDVLAERYRNVPPIPVSPAFDLTSVKTAIPGGYIPPSPAPRPFGLENCPEFFPTHEEFRDPMAYVRSISDKAREYGICKVVPPEGWKMPFVTDTESFRFKTRVQRLNSIEASSRAKLNFLEQLYQFHSQQGNPRVVVPTINHKPLDLWLLRKEVHKLGGYDAVCKAKKWSDLGRLLGYTGIPGLSTQIKNSYVRVILPYEHFCIRAKNSPNLGRDSPAKATTSTPNGKPESARAPAAATSRPSSPLSVTSSPLSEPPDEAESKDNAQTPSKPRRSTRLDSQDQTKPSLTLPAPTFYDTRQVKVLSDGEHHCEVCGKKNRGEEMLLCDGCDCGFHMFCLDPPLDAIPKDQWFCFTCLAGTGGDFGFEEGEEHSLSSLQARDLEFRKMWFESHPPPPRDNNLMAVDDPTANHFGNITVAEYDVEREFWRLVQTQNETVEIEYGADIHSTTHGSAMPTLETHPLEPAAKDPWNLNNIPIVSDSLLRFIKSDISGMTVPWTYVGMIFSTFCWHNEDHYTYSINFMHWGETKTWYGIPGDDAEKFEAAIQREAPDLFEAQPDLLFQLVTLMNPKRVTDAGVRVYACNQRAGEFVITYPKSYHAGFNHGLNFNEAVNFALPDWLAYDRDCVRRYRAHRKLPVFSHDELLITITQQSSSIKTAMWLIESLKEMTDREMENRRKARNMGLSETIEEEDRPEEQYQCTVCKAFCYLSQITCPCSPKVACVDHAELLCTRPLDHLTLRNRFSDADLLETQNKVAERAAVPSSWQAKLTKLLLESARPSLRSLRAILAEGERIYYPIPQLSTLRKCVARANEWVDAANSFTIRKQSRKRSRRSRGRASMNEPSGPDDINDRPDRSLDDLYGLLQEVETLGFDCPEITALQSLAQQAEAMKVKAANLLRSPEGADREAFIADCKRLLLDGSSLNVLLDELVEVEKIVDREQLLQELEEKLDDGEVNMTLEEVRHLLTRCRNCNLPSDNKHMQMLESRQRVGDNWEEKAKNILAQPIKTIEELEDFADLDPSIPIDPTILDKLMAARAKAKDFEKHAQACLRPDPDAPKPRAQEVMRLVTRAEKNYSIAAVHDLKRVASIAVDLETRCENVLKSRYRRSEGEDVFETMKTWKAYAQEHLPMFTLPMFEKLEGQLRLHYSWLQTFPWFCSEHEMPHTQEIMDDIHESTRIEDDLPPTDEYFTCICPLPVRPPPPGVVSDAVQCDHCYARFHGECAKNGGSCPFCDHHHWNGEIRKDRDWHFSQLPSLLQCAPEISRAYSEDFKQLEFIVRRIDRLSTVIGQFLSFTSLPVNQRVDYIPQVRHYMRKLFKIQFPVSPNRDVSYGLELARLHRLLATRPSVYRSKKRKRPRFTFGQDIDQDWSDGTRCICRGKTPYLLNYPAVRCESCAHLYHARCVFFPTENGMGKLYTCPICCLRKNRLYPYSEVRVKPPTAALGPPDPNLTGVYVDTRRMYETFSKDLILVNLDHPRQSTLFVDLIRYSPGQPEVPLDLPPLPPPPAQYHRPAYPPSLPPPIPRMHHNYSHGHPSHSHQSTRVPPNPYQSPLSSPKADHIPPRSSWSSSPQPSRWTGLPPSPPSRKRRLEDEEVRLPHSTPLYSKRRMVDDHPQSRSITPDQPPSLPPMQTLSPSLARILAPPPTERRTIYVPPS